MTEEMLILGLELIPILLTPVLALLGKLLADLIRGKVKNEYLQGALLRLNEAAKTGVSSVGQTYVKKMKEGKADGKLTDEEKKAAKDAALREVKDLLGPKGLKEIAKVVGIPVASKAMDSMLESKIEAKVKDNKDFLL